MKARWFVAPIVTVFFAYAYQAFAETAQEFHTQGEAAYKAKNYMKAVECYSEALKLEPERHETIYARGVNYYKLKKYGDALADFKKVQNEKKIDHHALNYIGLIYARTGEKTKAFAALKKATEIEPDNAAYCLSAARSAAQIEDLDAAETFYRRARKSASNEHEAHEGLRWIQKQRQANRERSDREISNRAVSEFNAKFGFPPVHGLTAEALSDVFAHCSRRGLSADLGIQYLAMLGINHWKQSPGTVTYVYYQLPDRPRHFYEVTIMENGKVLSHHIASKMLSQP